MTRFARAEGSKGSNKREYEESTPWEEMKADLEIKNKKKDKPKKSRQEGENESQNNVDNEENKKKSHKSKSKKKEKEMSFEHKKKNTKKQEYEEATPWEDMKADMEIPVNKIKKNSKKRKLDGDSNETQNDAALEVQQENENGIDGENQKISKKSKDEKNETPQEANKSNAKKKKKQMSLEQKKSNWIVKDGVKYKILKNGKQLPWLDLPYEENKDMTRYQNFYVKRDKVEELNNFRESLKDQGLDEHEIKKKMLHEERKVHNHLRVELLKAEIKKMNPSTGNKTHSNSKKKMDKNAANSFNKTNNGKYVRYDAVKFEENEFMTKFEDSWILKKDLNHLHSVANIKRQRIIADRTDGNEDTKFSPEEELHYRRLMKKEKRRANELLVIKIRKESAYSRFDERSKRGKPGRSLGIKYKENEVMVKFDGYFVRKDAAERLANLQKKMISEGCSVDEIENVIKNERRKEERILKRENKELCFKCRQVGHLLSDCPEKVKEGFDTGSEICFKCGSTEHMARHCPSNERNASFSYATCFVCKQVGHISRQCPDNPRGLYPNGGCCNECGSVEHLRRDCPDLQKMNKETSIKASRFYYGQEVEVLEDFSQNEAPTKVEKKMAPKIIKFYD